MVIYQMSREIKFDEWFLPENKRSAIAIGIELELLLFDNKNKEPLQNTQLCERVLNNLPFNIWKDFYSYQLEIRTKPHSRPDDIVKETRDLYKLASKEFIKHNVYVIPVPAITRGGFEAYCGLHAHISYPKDSNMDNMYYRAMGMYPPLLSLADHTKNFEVSDFNVSDRLEKSRHIGLAHLDHSRFMEGNRDNEKFRDLILSLPISNSDSRSRMKKPYTIEVRLIDTPSLFSFYEFIIYFLCNLASRIRVNNPMIKMLREDANQVSNNIAMTRDLMINQKYGINKIFRMMNSDVCEDISNYFDIKYERQTQFEFRKEKGYSADVNGFLSMATEGGWIN